MNSMNVRVWAVAGLALAALLAARPQDGGPERTLGPWELHKPGAWFRYEIVAEDESLVDTGLKEKGDGFAVVFSQEQKSGASKAATEMRMAHQTVRITGQEIITVEGRAWPCEILQVKDAPGGEKSWSVKAGPFIGAVLRTAGAKSSFEPTRVWEHRVSVKGKGFDCLVVEGNRKTGAAVTPVKTWYSTALPSGVLKSESIDRTLALVDFGTEWSKRPPFPGAGAAVQPPTPVAPPPPPIAPKPVVAPKPVPVQPEPPRPLQPVGQVAVTNPWERHEKGTWYRYEIVADETTFADTGLKEKGDGFLILESQEWRDGKTRPVKAQRVTLEPVKVYGKETISLDGTAYACEIQDAGDGSKKWVLKEGRHAGAILKVETAKAAITPRKAWEHQVAVKGRTFDCLVIEAEDRTGDFPQPVKTWYSSAVPGGFVKQESIEKTTALVDFGADWTQRNAPGEAAVVRVTPPVAPRPVTPEPPKPVAPPKPVVPEPARPVQPVAASKLSNLWERQEPGAWFRYTSVTEEETTLDTGLKEKSARHLVLESQSHRGAKSDPVKADRIELGALRAFGQETLTFDGVSYPCEIQDAGDGAKKWVLTEGLHAGAVIRFESPTLTLLPKKLWAHQVAVKGRTFDCLVVESEERKGGLSLPMKTWTSAEVPLGIVKQEGMERTLALVDFGTDWAQRPPAPGAGAVVRLTPPPPTPVTPKPVTVPPKPVLIEPPPFTPKPVGVEPPKPVPGTPEPPKPVVADPVAPKPTLPADPAKPAEVAKPAEPVLPEPVKPAPPQEPIVIQETPQALMKLEDPKEGGFVDLSWLEMQPRIGIAMFSEDYHIDPSPMVALQFRAPMPFLSPGSNPEREWFGAFSQLTFVPGMTRDLTPEPESPTGTGFFISGGLDFTFLRSSSLYMIFQAGGQYGSYGGITGLLDGFATNAGLSTGITLGKGLTVTLNGELIFGQAGDEIMLGSLGLLIEF